MGRGAVVKANEYRSLLQRTQNKYRAQRIVDPDFGPFDSKSEHQRFMFLKQLEKAGIVSQLHRPGSVAFLGKSGEVVKRYKPDFAYLHLGVLVYEDWKPVRKRDTGVIEKLWQSTFPNIQLLITSNIEFMPGDEP